MEFFDADAIIGRQLDEDEETAPTVDDLVAEMDRSGIARSLITNTRIVLSNPDWGNETLVQDITGKPRLRGVFGTWPMEDRGNPAPDVAIDRLIKLGAAGIQLWPAKMNFDLVPWQPPTLLGALSDRRLPAFIHADQTNYRDLHATLTAFPKLILVLQRVPYGDALRMLALMRACPNLLLCTSPHFVGGSIYEQFDRYIGSHRLLFGTGLFKYDALPAIAQLTYSSLSDDKKSAIAGGNLVRVLEGIR